MNQFALRIFVRSLINEAKEKKADKSKKKEASLPKSSGKLVDLKKELAALKTMKDELQAAKFAEKTASTEVEFANLAKFAKELDKIKAGGVALETSIDEQIKALKDKISAEKNKIKEIIGLTSETEKKEKIVGEKKELNEGQVIRILKDFKLGGKDFKKGDIVHKQPYFNNIINDKELKKGIDYTIGIGSTMEENKPKSPSHEETDANQVYEAKKMTSAQKEKKEDIVKGMKKSGSFGKSKEEKSKMYATATKLATKKK